MIGGIQLTEADLRSLWTVDTVTECGSASQDIVFLVNGGYALTSRGETQPSGLGRDRVLTAKLWLVNDRVPILRNERTKYSAAKSGCNCLSTIGLPSSSCKLQGARHMTTGRRNGPLYGLGYYWSVVVAAFMSVDQVTNLSLFPPCTDFVRDLAIRMVYAVAIPPLHVATHSWFRVKDCL